MAYATGVASSADDFLAQLVSFAVANAGFTNEGTVTSSAGTGSRTIQRISKGGIWWNFLRFSGGAGVHASMGYTGLASGAVIATTIGGDKQSHHTWMGFWGFTGPFVGHYFFTDGTVVHAVLEIASGIYNHISFGSVSKLGSWTGGEYVTAGYYETYKPNNVWEDWNSSYCTRPFNDANEQNSSNSSYSFVRHGNAGTSADFRQMRSTWLSSSGMFVGYWDDGNYTRTSMYTRLLRDAPNDATGRAPIFPGVLRLWDSASSLMRLAGKIPYVGIMKMPNDMNPGDIINTDWQVFPITQRTGGNSSVAALSHDFALAYRRV